MGRPSRLTVEDAALLLVMHDLDGDNQGTNLFLAQAFQDGVRSVEYSCPDVCSKHSLTQLCILADL